jgi:hypothetical protein
MEKQWQGKQRFMLPEKKDKNGKRNGFPIEERENGKRNSLKNNGTIHR